MGKQSSRRGKESSSEPPRLSRQTASEPDEQSREAPPDEASERADQIAAREGLKPTKYVPV
jgi:hypothetical protein